jgi:DnaK suppressor protein
MTAGVGLEHDMKAARARLLARRVAVLEQYRAARRDALAAAEQPSAPMDVADLSSREEIVTYFDQLTDRDIHTIRAIDDALLRVDEGRYGTCQRCGGPIESGRLDSFPETDLCAACARIRDRGVHPPTL